MPVLRAAQKLGVNVESVCGARGLCGRCQIKIESGKFAKYGVTSAPENLSVTSELEIRYRAVKPLAEDRRLSCSALIQGDLVVEIPSDARTNKQVVRKRAESRVIERKLITHLCYVEVPPPDLAAPSGDADRLITALEKDWGYSALAVDAELLASLQPVLREGKWKITAAIFQEEGGAPSVTGIWPGLKETIYGIAVDVGSTTIAAHLCDLMTGEVVATAGALNPQIRFGEDLMSRISYIQMNPGSQPELTAVVRETVDALVRETAEGAAVETADIVEAVIVGNPIMHHLFLDIDPTELGGAPFALAISSALTQPAAGIVASLPVNARIHTLPCIAGHVGADAAAVTLSERPYQADATTLLVDIGTNAEIVLGNRKLVMAASSPTGPAFEGAEISCGQRAAPGAIERVRIDRETYAAKFKIIGSELWSDEAGFAAEAEKIGITGICGSGIVEVIAEMYLSGIISPEGVILSPESGASDHIVPTGRTFNYVIHAGEIEISVSQKDVRAVQLAKAALYAGARLLMDKLEIEEVAQIKLAGAFGSYIDPKYAMVLGLIPDCDLKQVSGIGNAASTGARMALLNKQYRHEIQQEVKKLVKVETAMEERFQEHFVNAMAFPNNVEPFSQLRAQVTLPVHDPDTDAKRRARARERKAGR
ncbi:MAG: DUF4445 domain-containing protein [Rhodospirillaceae bacterium]|nr:DUF4445 domain-containing protein [Rhodospirillaceae bacterium]